MHIESINLYNTCINFNAINILNDDNDVRYNCTKKSQVFSQSVYHITKFNVYSRIDYACVFILNRSLKIL